jgi:hypothetical protein
MNDGIGLFQIGVSPIGTQPFFDPETTLISQYANSPRILQIIANFFSCVDQTENLDDFFDLMWNVDTAQGYGLDVWGRIVGVSRVLELSSGVFFGFEGEGAGAEPFNSAPFYGGASDTSNFLLSDAAYRQLILAKALANICDGSTKAINQLLISLFGTGGNCYVVDNLDMSMVYHFTFVPNAIQLAIIQQSGVLPKPTGVSVTVSVP